MEKVMINGIEIVFDEAVPAGTGYFIDLEIVARMPPKMREEWLADGTLKFVKLDT